VDLSAIDGSRKGASGTILLTEWAYNSAYTCLADIDTGGANIVKSHRPVSPVVGLDGSNPLATTAINNPAPYKYIQIETPSVQAEFGYFDRKILAPQGLLTFGNSASSASAVGRHHAGKDPFGGSANFAFVDGHVENSTIAKTIRKRLWGDRYYSIRGTNGIQNLNEIVEGN
jgi:prepilin-type processing-associated H-X9-DG protein